MPNRTVKEYKLVQANDSGLEAVVIKLLGEGWQPLGGVSAVQNHIYVQAMVKFEPERA